MLKLNGLTLIVQMCTDPSYGIIANMMLICFFTAWRKSIRRLWKIQNTTHCNLLSSINSSVPIVINLERRCSKFIRSCLNSDNSIVKTIAKSAKCSSVSNF